MVLNKPQRLTHHQNKETKPNQIYLIHFEINRIWHSITYNGWYTIKPNQTKPISFSGLITIAPPWVDIKKLLFCLVLYLQKCCISFFVILSFIAIVQFKFKYHLKFGSKLYIMKLTEKDLILLYHIYLVFVCNCI